MHKLFYLLTAAAFATVLGAGMPFAAKAADMPLKALPAVATSGGYVCIETGAAVAQASANGGLFATSLVQGNLIAAGGQVGGCGGYVWGNARSWWGIDVSADYQNIAAHSDMVGANVNIASRWSATQEVRFGGSGILSWLQGAISNLGLTGITFPTFSPPTGNAHLSAAPHNYFAVGVREMGVEGTFGTAGGTTISIAPLVRAGAIWQVLDSTTGRPTGSAIDVSAWVAWHNKGITVSNVFGTVGGPVVGPAGGNMTTTYGTTLRYAFGVTNY
jgi:hypothetical protein